MPGIELNEEQKYYFKVHKKRYEILLSIVDELKENKKTPCRILDIGPSFFTKILIEHYPQDKLAALGLSEEASKGGHLPSFEYLEGIEFINFDLNSTHNKKLLPKINIRFDIIIFAEIIEHLHIAPEYVFRFLREILDKEGYVILQTPNAVSLIKRVQMLFGKNPYELIRENFMNPGHFREYTMQEIKALVEKEGLVVRKIFCKNYFTLIPNNWKTKIYRFGQILLGEKFKDGITAVITR
jgi:SAM-dependent methyltransferase